MALEGIKKYRVWKNRRKEIFVALRVSFQLWDELGWGTNKIEYFTKYIFEYTTKVVHVENKPFDEFKHDHYWHAQYMKYSFPKKGQPLPPNFQGNISQDDHQYCSKKKSLRMLREEKLKKVPSHNIL